MHQNKIVFHGPLSLLSQSFLILLEFNIPINKDLFPRTLTSSDDVHLIYQQRMRNMTIQLLIAAIIDYVLTNHEWQNQKMN